MINVILTIAGVIAIIGIYSGLWHLFRLFDRWFLGDEREGFFESLNEAQDAIKEWKYRKYRASIPSKIFQPSNDFHLKNHKDNDRKVLCKGCKKPLGQSQIDYMLGNPQYQQWSREGYCSFSCYEKTKEGKKDNKKD